MTISSLHLDSAGTRQPPVSCSVSVWKSPSFTWGLCREDDIGIVSQALSCSVHTWGSGKAGQFFINKGKTISRVTLLFQRFLKESRRIPLSMLWLVNKRSKYNGSIYNLLHILSICNYHIFFQPAPGDVLGKIDWEENNGAGCAIY